MIAAATPGGNGASRRVATLERSVIIGFKAGEGSIEHLTERHDNDVVTGGDFVAPEDFTRQALGAISFGGTAEPSGCRHPESRRLTAVGEHEDGHEPAGNARSLVIDALELGPAPDPLVGRQAFAAHSSATVNRLRPLARRRFSTIRPFFVDIRTRKPCVFFRLRVFG